jgi:hypothetical protein
MAAMSAGIFHAENYSFWIYNNFIGAFDQRNNVNGSIKEFSR